MKLFAFTMDLEADYGGVVNHYGIFEELHKLEELLSDLRSLGVKLTVFTVGEIFESYPKVIKLFEKFDCEFESHSYSHDFENPDSETEIKKAKLAYYNYFKKNPLGYRAPRGKISDSGIKHLEEQGFLYDSSIFPSYFPNPFRYLLSDKEIHYYRDSSVMEIPITSVSPARVTLSISYIKLFGLNFFIKQQFPDIICFDTHLHDFIINETSFSKLPLVWKLIYSRNKFRGRDLCVSFLDHITRKGYKFCYMSEIHNYNKRQS